MMETVKNFLKVLVWVYTDLIISQNDDPKSFKYMHFTIRDVNSQKYEYLISCSLNWVDISKALTSQLPVEKD